jgi:TfoX/Sxy family transcriptional regulator of competence genes
MKIPHPDDDSKEFLRSILPNDPRIAIRPMFGNISAFINGNMFTGLFGNDLFVRLSEESRRELLENKGASLLEPMKGKPMKEYVVIPKAWRNQHETVRIWVTRSLDWASKLPPKKTKK